MKRMLIIVSMVLAVPSYGAHSSLTEGVFVAAHVNLSNEPWIPADSQTPDPTFAALYTWSLADIATCDLAGHNTNLRTPSGTLIYNINGQLAAPTTDPSVGFGLFKFTGQYYNRIPAGATAGNLYVANFGGGLLWDLPLIGGLIPCITTPLFSGESAGPAPLGTP